MLNGKVKFFHRKDNYGFIKADDGNEYYFNTNKMAFPQEGDRAAFLVKQERDRTVAHKVKILYQDKASGSKLFRIASYVIAIAIGVVIGYYFR